MSKYKANQRKPQVELIIMGNSLKASERFGEKLLKLGWAFVLLFGSSLLLNALYPYFFRN